MNTSTAEPTLWEDDGSPETVYITGACHPTSRDWTVTSLDVGSWRPLHVGDRLVALDRASSAEFIVEVVDVQKATGEVYYRLLELGVVDPAKYPGLDATRT